MDLYSIFASLPIPPNVDGPESYSAAPSSAGAYRIAKDRNGWPIMLLSCPSGDERASRIQLAHLDIQPMVRCRVTGPSGTNEDGVYVVVRCTDANDELARYFFRTFDPILRGLGASPTAAAVSGAINALAELFRALTLASGGSVAGLWAELFIIRTAANPVVVAEAWHATPDDRYDFSAGSQRLEVKSTSLRVRMHSFSLEQLVPPAGCRAVVASLFVDRAGGGVSLGTLVDQTLELLAERPDLQVRIDRVVAATLGAGLRAGLAERFDLELARESLRYFETQLVPAVQTPLPLGVSEVHFKSDLSRCTSLDSRELRGSGGFFCSLA